MWSDVDFWKAVTIVAALVGQTIFVALYATFSWWRSYLGRALMIKSSTLLALLCIAVLGLVVDWKKEHATLTVLYGLVAVGIWAQTIAFIRVKIQAIRAERESR